MGRFKILRYQNQSHQSPNRFPISISKWHMTMPKILCGQSYLKCKSNYSKVKKIGQDPHTGCNAMTEKNYKILRIYY